MKKTALLSTWLSILLLLSCKNNFQPSVKSLTHSPYDLQSETLASRWDEAIPLGNGMMGVLIWEKEGKLRLSLDRADVWDLRPVEALRQMTFDWVHQQVKKGEYKPVQELGDVPYDRDPFPTKLPLTALEFEQEAWGAIESTHLFIKEAIAEVTWKNGVSLKTFVHATEPAGWFRFENLPREIIPQLMPPQYAGEMAEGGQEDQSRHGLGRLGYAQGEVASSENKIVYTQPCTNGMSYEVVVQWENTENTCEGSWYISVDYPENEKWESTGEVRDNHKKFHKAFETHREWWQSFWGQSDIKVPDSVIMRQYHLEMYKFGSVARQGAPPISLQAVWTADNGNLPPWKGDFHHDLNTQLSYWPGYAGNHLELTASFTDWLWQVREENRDYTQWYFGVEGLNVPGVTTLTGQPMGGWIQYSLSPTVAAWLAQHFYWQWKYSMDEDFLKERTYPYIHDVATYLENITFMKDGVRKLPLSSSPEYNDNRLEAWFTEYTNYDLSLIKFAFKTAAELAAELGKNEEKENWLKRFNELPPLSIDPEKGLNIATGTPLEHSHRHFSHLMAIHPLGLLDPEYGEEDRKVIENSLRTLEEKGTRKWVGYSFSWQANMYARTGNGEKAAEALKIFAENFTSPNSFHLNGDQHGGQYSDFTYRPFTLEGNFAFAAGLQEMLLQSHSGVVEIFPAIPEAWQEVSFDSLRTQGAFLVSARREKGKLSRINILAEKGGELLLNTGDIEQSTVQLNSEKVTPERNGNIFSFSLQSGDHLELLVGQ